MKTKEERPCLFKKDCRVDLKTRSRGDLLKSPVQGYITGMIGDSSYWTIYYNEYNSCVMGPSVFWKKIRHTSVTFKGGKLYGDKDAPLYAKAAEVLGLEWANYQWVPRLLRNNKTLWQMVFSKKITNPEALAKRYSKLYFKGTYSYRSLKEYFTRHSGVSLYDIYHYTSNPNLFLERLHKKEYPQDLLFDILKYCSYTNTKMNPAWSVRRMAEYHQEQIEEELKEEVSSKSTVNITEPVELDGLSCILNERDAFMESQLQHNCVYRCYWHQVEAGKYLVFKGNFCDRRVTLGIRIIPIADNYEFKFDQIHTIYNGCLDKSAYNKALQWMAKHKDSLIELVKDINKKLKLSSNEVSIDTQEPFDDIPVDI